MPKSFLVAASSVFFASLGIGQTLTYTYSYQGLPLYIATDDAQVISVANILVPNALNISKVTFSLQINYPEVGDLLVYLYSPEGTRTIILGNDCGSLANVDTTFDDSAQSKFRDFCPVEAGRGPFRPNQPLSNFNSDTSSFGTWRIAIQNTNSQSRSGWFLQAAITITGTPQLGPAIGNATVVDSASFRGDSIAPGESLSIFGANLGPTPAVSAASTAFPASLGGTTVTINGSAVPISYASPFLVNVQVPLGLPWGSLAAIQVNNNGKTSNTASLTVASTNPGIYTAAPGGTGQVKAVNQDGSANSALHPAAKGSVVTIWASGLGSTTPSVPSGQPTPATPLSNTNQPVTATVGRVPATVLFAGLAPGYIGLYQINLMLDPGTPSGTDEIILSEGGNSSQIAATIQVQ